MEAIQCAALRRFDEQGRATIIWGYKKDLSNAHHLIRDFLIDHNPVHGSNLFKKAEQGFYTTEERFVSREEALHVAAQSNQIIHKHPSYDELYSEDLRPCPAVDHTGCQVRNETR
jgi:hypothetical protein